MISLDSRYPCISSVAAGSPATATASQITAFREKGLKTNIQKPASQHTPKHLHRQTPNFEKPPTGFRKETSALRKPFVLAAPADPVKSDGWFPMFDNKADVRQHANRCSTTRAGNPSSRVPSWRNQLINESIFNQFS